MTDTQHISQVEAAEWLGVDRKTIYRMRKRGKRMLRKKRRHRRAYLDSVNTAGATQHGGKVMIPLRGKREAKGRLYLGWFDFLAALSPADPVTKGYYEQLVGG